MRIPLDRMVDGLVHALTQQVVPHVSDRYARGQLWSVVDVLANLRDRIDWRAAPLEDEIASAVATLEQLGAILREGGDAAPLPSIPATASPAERALAGRVALAAAIERVAALPPELVERARGPLGAHLAGCAFRDMQTFKPSLLNEISKG